MYNIQTYSKMLIMITKFIHKIEIYTYNHTSNIKSRKIAENISKISKWKMIKSSMDEVGYITLGLHINLSPFIIAYIDTDFDFHLRKNIFNVELYCTKKTHDLLLDVDNNNAHVIAYKEHIYIKAYYDNYIIKHNQIDIFMTPTIKQKCVIEKILEYYRKPKLLDVKKQHICIAYLHGPPGVGKSTIGRFLAQELHGTFAKINPSTKYDINIKHLYYCYNRNDFHNLIINLDDYDKILLKIIQKKSNSTKSEESSKSEVYDIASHNSLFDMFRTMNNIIILVTANKSSKEVEECINEIDTSTDCSISSIFRKGRIDLFIDFNEDDIIN